MEVVRLTDIFDDNPHLYTTGSVREIAEKIEREWWENARTKIDKLSKEIGFEIIENLPREYQKNLLSDEEEYKYEKESFLDETKCQELSNFGYCLCILKAAWV